MSSAIYTNTGIVESSWNSRGLITHNFINKTLIAQDNGVLWAAVREDNPTKYINIYRSIDNGFSWQNLWSGTFVDTDRKTGINGINLNGPVMHLVLNEKLNLLHLFHSYYDQVEEEYNIQLFSFEITSSGITRLDSESAPNNAWLERDYLLDMDSLAYDISYNDSSIYMSYVYISNIYFKSFSHTYFEISDGGTPGTTDGIYFDLISTYVDDNNLLHVLALQDYNTSFRLVYLTYDKIGNAISSPKIISEIPMVDVVDLNISLDGLGNILAYWSQRSEDGVFINEYYSISQNQGISWSDPIAIPQTLGQSNTVDNPTGQKTSRTTAISCNEGFILSYIRSKDGKSNAYVRTLDKINSEYVLSSESIAASHATKDVMGIRFFKPVATGKYNINTKEEIRFAYQVGQGNSQIQRDKSPVYFGQKLLNDEAFPNVISVNYNEDVAQENQLLASFNLLGSTYENVDYYNEGLIGPITAKYVSAFDRFGTSINIELYEPIQESVLSDKSSYIFESSYYVKAFFQDINYSFPSPSSNESYTTYIERDMRKLHLPPTFHLSRTFIINDGNKLKRTVWLATFDGNQYELSQVVPKFVDNQIAYYTANAYVVGPSNNPFTRTILPSET